MTCLPSWPKSFGQACSARPRPPALASNHCETPKAGAQFLPISAAVGREISAHRGARARATQRLSWRGNMESRRATTEQRRERAELDPRFGAIGISAVAGAGRYRSEAKRSEERRVG